MKKFVLAAMAAVVMSTAAQAEEYLPLIEKGSEWTYSSATHMGTRPFASSYVFSGEKTENGKTYTLLKNIRHTSASEMQRFDGVPCFDLNGWTKSADEVEDGFLLREEGGVVYMLLAKDLPKYVLPATDEAAAEEPEIVPAGTEIVVLDFNKKEGEKFTTLFGDRDTPTSVGEVLVRKVEEKEICGIKRRVLEVASPAVGSEDNEAFVSQLVEGLGYVNQGGFLMMTYSSDDIAGNMPYTLSLATDKEGKTVYAGEGNPLLTVTNTGLTATDRVWEYYSEVDNTARQILRFRNEGTERRGDKEYTRLVNFLTWSWEEGSNYKREAESTETVALIREEGMKLYRLVGEGIVDKEGNAVDKDKEVLLYDFSLSAGDRFTGVRFDGNKMLEVEYQIEKIQYTFIGEDLCPMQSFKELSDSRYLCGAGDLGAGILSAPGVYGKGYVFNGVFNDERKSLIADYEYKSAPDKTLGVEEIESADAAGEVRIYDLYGVEHSAANLAPGIYIKVQGSKSQKILVK